MAFGSLEEMAVLAAEQNKPLWEIILEDDMHDRDASKEDSWKKMCRMWEAMLASVENYEGDITSASGLVGGMGAKMEAYGQSGQSLCGDFVSKVMATALKTGESNACMKRIVAAPTAGACGVLPAVLVPFYQETKCGEERIVQALYVAAGIGQVIAYRAFIAGASGGCQAEIGSASAMAAGAMTFLKGGDTMQIMQAAAMALKNLLGLVCDPVAGLVEVPCVKRNVVGAVNALSSADMALAGIFSKIPPDQVIDAMREVGEKMHDSLKETAMGGIANTPEARKLTQGL